MSSLPRTVALCLGFSFPAFLPHQPAVSNLSGRVGQLPPTGLYGEHLALVQRADGSLIGSFQEQQGTQPVFSCGFLLASSGAPSPDGTVPITTWWPDRELHGGKSDERAPGKLFLHGGTVSLQLPKNAHGGCWNVEHELNEGEISEVGTGVPHPEWKDLRVVSSSKLEFHHRPDPNDFTKAYVVQGDVLLLLDTSLKDGVWRHVQLVNDAGAKGTGWVLDSGLLAWSVPSH